MSSNNIELWYKKELGSHFTIYSNTNQELNVSLKKKPPSG
jgi:hypothetical protein